MAYSELRYINKKAIERIKKICKVYKPKDSSDKSVKDTFEDFDYVIEITDYDALIENSILKQELSKIDKLKLTFSQVNDSMLQERGKAEIDELEETSDKEIMNRALMLNLKRRGLSFTNQDNVYYKSQIDESYNVMKSYFLDLSLTCLNNRDFTAISRRLKKSVASKSQEFTFFRVVAKMTDGKKRYVVIIPELKYNNERFGKNIYKLFAPYTTLVLCEVVQIMIKESRTWKQSRYYLSKTHNKNIIELSSMGV